MVAEVCCSRRLRVIEVPPSARRGALMVAAETRRYLAEHGVDLGGEQPTKTRKALEYFAANLTDQAGAIVLPGVAELDAQDDLGWRRGTSP